MRKPCASLTAMLTLRSILALALAPLCFAQSWSPQTSGVTVAMRGVSAVGDGVVWASGSGGTWLLSTDGGSTWKTGVVPGAEALDFRGIRGFDDKSAILMSAGPGDKSKIYSTSDAGETWKLLFTNPDAKGFFDAINFPDRNLGFLLGDPVDGHLTVFRTGNGGADWIRVEMPEAVAGEGAFAASNSNIVVGGWNVWIATGGAGAGRVYHSSDGGKAWAPVETPIRKDGPSAGIFSIAFADPAHGVAVGGEYTKATERTGNIAVTDDGGTTWTAPKGQPPAGYRSSVAYLPDAKLWIATGPSGSDVSADGSDWKNFDAGSYNALSVAPDGAVWAVGQKGRIAKLVLKMP